MILPFISIACARNRRCVDVGEVQACYDAHARPTLGARVLPDGPPPENGWRCDGEGGHRRCVDRRRAAGPFRCSGDRCEQRYPRLPDDAQWECIDLDGAVVCRGGEPAAAVVPGRPDVGWTCGVRAGSSKERICVDFAPDLPPGERRGWRCQFEHTGGERRLCNRDANAPTLGAACRTSVDCGTGGRSCTGGRCLPARLDPACWLHTDCGAARRCLDGSCSDGTG